MAKMAELGFSLISILFVFMLAAAHSTSEKADHGLEIAAISKALSDRGYIAMSMVLEAALPTLIPFESTHTTMFTIFCPTDSAVFALKYSQPPLHLLQYHLIPSKLTREALESSIKPESKVDTLLQGHPLVLTTLPEGPISINDVKIKDWDIYNDGHVIVHGIEEFFDPAFQTVEYPWFDGRVVKKDENNNLWKRLEEIFFGIKKLY